MGKKKQKQIQYTPQTNVKAAELTPSSNNLFKNKQLWIFIILFLTALAYIPIFSNTLIDNWDDGVYITKNDIIKELNLKRLFTAFYGGNYHPFIALFNALEYHFFEFNPVIYHFNNLLFHLLNAFLVFKLVEMLTKKNEIAVITSLFFGIHPMHVESVAWAAERKDVLYTFFYLLALMSYIKYITIKEKNVKYFIYALIFITCSLFSKSAAVAFPLLLFLVDWFYKRKINFKLILEKLPFFALALTFGIIALFSQKSAISTKDVGALFEWWEKPFLACYATCLYFYKMFIPVNLSAIYPYPNRTDGFLPILYYLSPIAVLIISYFVYKTLKTTRYIAFGFLFFFITIILVLQILPVGGFIVAERYVYVPYIGTFLILGIAYSNVLNSMKSKAIQFRPVFTILLLLFAVVCTALTFERTKVWKRGDTVFLDAVKNNPVPMAFDNIGYFYYLRKEYDKSFEYYSKCLNIDPNFHEALNMRGVVNFNLNKFNEAVTDYNRAIQLKPNDTASYIGRANSLSKINKFEEAIKDYNFYLKNKPKADDAYFYRGVAYFSTNRFDEAMSDFNTSIKLNKKNFQAYLKRGILYYKAGKFIEALNDMNEAEKLNSDNSEIYSWRGLIYYSMKNVKKAIEDYTSAIRLNPNDVAAYVNRAGAYQDLFQFDNAVKDAEKAKSMGFQLDVNYFKSKKR
ncbi:MAG: tetratricopeptide repeat protein [Bacteroidales bacterium]|nr:tetratricopeptide repeat protein [Bacteroidales bacterium]